MARENRFSLEAIADEPWAARFTREFDLVVASNVLRSSQTGKILYDAELEARVAEFCAPLDGGLAQRFVGTLEIPGDRDARWARVMDAKAFLKEAARGTWAIFGMDGGFDIFMADGCGGTATPSGQKFLWRSATASALCFGNAYAAVLGTEVYNRRHAIRAEIADASFAAHTVPAGTIARDVRFGGQMHTYSKVEYLGPAGDRNPGDPAAPLVMATRRGVRPVEVLLTRDGFLATFGLPSVMPERYRDPGNSARLSTRMEARVTAANRVLVMHFAGHPVADLHPFPKPGYWTADGDTVSCPVCITGDSIGDPSGRFSVRFAPGSAGVVGSDLAWTREPAAEPAAPRL